MLLVFVTCASIITAAPGCRLHRVPLVVDVIPAGCAARVQEALAERIELHSGEALVRYGCERRRPRQEAEARP